MNGRKTNLGIVITSGLVTCIPFYAMIGSTPVFFVQVAAYAAFFALFTFHHDNWPLNDLDRIIIVYVGWIVFTFLLNFPFFYFDNRTQLSLNQLVSAITSLALMIPYLIGRNYFRDIANIDLFRRTTLQAFGLLLLASCFFYYHYLDNLYTARNLVAQRLPMMVAFIGWAVCSLGFWGLQPKWLSFFSWTIASLLVLLSLTRASYIQWAVSSLAFVIVSFACGHWRFGSHTIATAVLAQVVLGAVGLAISIGPDSRLDSTLITERMGQLVTADDTIYSDDSANSRLEIWDRLTRKLLETPLRVVVGYGQLGPSNLSEGFTNISGERLETFNAHSQYLDTVIRSGVTGAILELGIVIALIAKPFQLRIERRSLGFFHAHSIALIGMVFYGIFHETLRWEMFGLYFWLYAGIVSAHLYPNDKLKTRTSLQS